MTCTNQADLWMDFVHQFLEGADLRCKRLLVGLRVYEIATDRDKSRLLLVDFANRKSK